MPKDIATGTTRALARVLHVLQSTLTAELATVADVGLYLPAPTENAFFWLAASDRLDEILPNHNVACFCYQVGPRTILERRTQGPTEYSALTQIIVEVTIAFRMAPQTPLQAPGWSKTLTTEELLVLRAQRYSAGVANSLLTYLINPDDCNDLDLINETSALDAIEVEPIGLSTTQWAILQDCRLPRPLYTI